MSELIPSNEEAATGVTEKEPELCFYLHATDLQELRGAIAAIEQEQYSMPSFDSKKKFLGNIRIRRTRDSKNPNNKFVMTIKNKTVGDTDSTAYEVTEDIFLQFRKLVDGAGLYKHRYVFTIPDSDLVWEVDVFSDGEGGYFEWVKLDLEYPEGQKPEKTPPFPISYDKVLTHGKDEDVDQIRELYDRYFQLKPISVKNDENLSKQ